MTDVKGQASRQQIGNGGNLNIIEATSRPASERGQSTEEPKF